MSDPTVESTIAAPTVRALRVVAVSEAVSWLVLIAATVVKYAAGNALGVHVMGPIHGVLFVAYVGLALEVRGRVHWDARTTLIVLADAILPGGGFLVARRRELRGV